MVEHNVTLEVFYGGGWHPAPILQTAPVRYRRGVTSIGDDSDPADGAATIDNASRQWNPDSLESGLYGLIGQNSPFRLSADGSVRMAGEVARWAPTRPIVGSSDTAVQLAGVLRRIGRGTDPIYSALRRYYRTNPTQPAAYWPLEDAAKQTVAYDDINGTPTGLDSLSGLPGYAGNVQFGDGYLSAGSSSVANLAGNWTLNTAIDRSRVTPTGAITFQWHANFGTTVRTGTNRILKTSLLFDDTQPRYLLWQCFTYENGTIELKALEFTAGTLVAGPTTVYSAAAIATPFDGTPRAFQLNLTASGGTDVAWALHLNGVTLGSGTYTPGFAGAMNADPYLMQHFSEAPNDNPCAFGHVAVFTANIPVANGSWQALNGWQGERAADRFARLCTEEGITPTVVGTAAESVPMGPQGTDPFLDQLDEIGRTDNASIFETRGALGLTMRTGGGKLNQSPALTLNFLGGVVPPLLPVLGDEGIRNDITTRNPDGTTRRAVQATGPQNVQPPPAGVGRYKTSVEVNTSSVADLAGLAGLRLQLGTFKGTWYAAVTVPLDQNPGLVAAVNAVDIGDRVDIANLPAGEARDSFAGIVIGIAESLPPKTREVTFYLVPGQPYTVGVLAAATGDTNPVVGRAADNGDVTTAGAAAGAASFLVTTPTGPLWTTVGDDFPLEVLAGGQQVTIASITGAANPQTFTVSTVSGAHVIRYPIPAGAAVEVAQPLIVTM